MKLAGLSGPLLCIFFILSDRAFAVQETVNTSAFPDPVPGISEARPLKFFEKALASPTGSRRIKTLSKAYGFVQSKKFSSAIVLFDKKSTPDLYQDYEYWILFESYKGLAQQQIEKNQYALSTKSAKKAVAAFLSIEEQHPFSPFVRLLHQEIGKIELILGDAYFAIKNWNEAKKAFENAFQRLDSTKDRMYIRTRNVDHYAASCKSCPTHFCKEWLKKLSFAFRKKSDEAQAIYKYFPAIENLNPPVRAVPGRVSSIPYKSPDLDQAAFEAAIKLFFQRKFGDAIKAFAEFIDTYPRSSYRFRVKFWMAQALGHKKEFDRSKKIYQEIRMESPLTYYGLLSSSALGIPIDSLVNFKFEVLATDQDTNLLPSERFHVQRAENFIREGVLDLARFELKEIQSRESLSTPFLVYLAFLSNKAKNFRFSFLYWSELAQRKYEGVLTPTALKMIFPTDFIETVTQYSNQLKIDPLLVLSLIKQESAFNQDIVSSSGAVGLMQLMPGTALETDLEIKSQDLINIEKNIRVGTKYLRKLLDRFNGNIALSLAGYNAGPNAADRWYKSAQSKQDLFEFIEFIPYKETREYVSSIIRNYFWYSAQLKKPLPPQYNYFWLVAQSEESLVSMPTPSPTPLPEAPSVLPVVVPTLPVPMPKQLDIPSPSPSPSATDQDKTPAPTVLPRIEPEDPTPRVTSPEVSVPVPEPHTAKRKCMISPS